MMPALPLSPTQAFQVLDKLDHPARITGHVSGNPVINPAVIRQQMGRVRSDDPALCRRDSSRIRTSRIFLKEWQQNCRFVKYGN